eukprot:CAMPEP_0176392652 /NCGR_PEP_ID=MMETSP0126-20121128/41041_1 /TAXON_ID=141414 ORGANISM="Strombidinopsis acuminatum, Strain SPMC142" /NCGR_SAMPLE_ID=MMETSP0126 /ASSEMBLY_ACC=CAM_ASM_000229 /LENGTH=33 /DNA_ID= /DNA_START= /DNA_END= /DNA_ORIENTATION=
MTLTGGMSSLVNPGGFTTRTKRETENEGDIGRP